MSIEKTLRELVAIPSVTGDEKNIIAYITKQLSAQGHSVIKFDNWVGAKISGTDSSKALIYNGHVDTVPGGEKKAWKTDPHILTKNNGALMGLGASDMKSGIAVMLALAETFKSVRPKRDVWFCFAAGEEVDGTGSQEFTAWFNKHQNHYAQTGIVVLEPTDCAFIGVGHRGNMALSISLHGKSGHGSNPGAVADNHAILRAFEAIKRVKTLGSAWQSTYLHPTLGKPSVVVSAVTTGTGVSRNKFPAKCSFSVDIRTTPELEAIAESQINAALEDLHPDIVHICEPFAAMACDPRDELVGALQSIRPELSTKTFPGATDLSFLKSITNSGVIYGPGNSKTMHIANESMIAENLKKCYNDLVQLAERYV